jgi:RNA polymerase sigma-70 factor (ECF subfamily)
MAVATPRISVIATFTPPSLDALYRAHAATVARWAVRLGGPTVDPDDVAQEVFMVAARRLEHFRGDAEVTTWLFRITSKVVANHRRRSWLRRVWSHLTGGATEVPVPAEQWPGATLDARERVRQLYALLEELPEKQRRVLVLFELDEMSTADIAALIGVPHATVRVWLHRARARLLDAVARSRGEERR